MQAVQGLLQATDAALLAASGREQQQQAAFSEALNSLQRLYPSNSIGPISAEGKRHQALEAATNGLYDLATKHGCQEVYTAVFQQRGRPGVRVWLRTQRLAPGGPDLRKRGRARRPHPRLPPPGHACVQPVPPRGLLQVGSPPRLPAVLRPAPRPSVYGAACPCGPSVHRRCVSLWRRPGHFSNPHFITW